MTTISREAISALLEDAAARDLTTARRKALFELLAAERFLSREGLIARVEAALGEGCFGQAAWEDTFYRDMRVVKQAFLAAGDLLAYSRRPGRTGYYLKGSAGLGPDLASIVQHSTAEVDPAQIEIYRKLSPAKKFRQGASISDLARRASAHTRRQRENAGD